MASRRTADGVGTMQRSQIRLDLLEATPPAAIPEFAQCFDVFETRFERYGAFGLLVLQFPDLAELEREYGGTARRQVLQRLGELARRQGAKGLGQDDLVVAGEPGCDEILVLVFREPRDGRFYREDLPAFEQSFCQEVGRVGAPLLEPYGSRAVQVVGGTAAALRNPKFGTDTQFRSTLEEARDDADWHARGRARNRRRRILDVVLDRQIRSVYEPIVAVETKTVHGYEALARGPAGSELHLPLDLFRLAEQEGLVYELDCLCRSSGLEGAVGLPSGTKLFLNIRPTTIHDPHFESDQLIRTLGECGLTPGDIVFEISEQEAIRNFASFKRVRDRYRELGFEFALDDTGTGYAGLEALVEISPDYIKVDRSFVSGIDGDSVRQTMLAALQTVAERTNARLVAEGLDTLEELETLSELNIPFGQGWLFGKPTPLLAEPR